MRTRYLKIFACTTAILTIQLAFLTKDLQCGGAEDDMNQEWIAFRKLKAHERIVDYYPYADCFKKASRRYRIPLVLLLAVAKGESDFDPKSKSVKECYGIMQIRWPNTAKELGFRNINQLYDPCRNIMAGAEYLRKMLDMHNDNIHLALAAYNYGPTRIPGGISDSAIPKGANWYSGYIYYHMKTILKRNEDIESGQPAKVYRRSGKLPIITFQEVYRAEGFIGHIEERDPSIRLEWFRTPSYRYSVVMLYRGDLEKTKFIESLGKIGYKVDESEKF